MMTVPKEGGYWQKPGPVCKTASLLLTADQAAHILQSISQESTEIRKGTCPCTELLEWAGGALSVPQVRPVALSLPAQPCNCTTAAL